jgi:hypothetical protein
MPGWRGEGSEEQTCEASLHQREATLTLVGNAPFGSDVAQPLRGRRGEH